MAHNLDTSNDRYNFAFVSGVKPWHGLGFEIPLDASLDDMRKAAGLEWSVTKTPAHFHTSHTLDSNGKITAYNSPAVPYRGRHVLYRNDTLAPLGICGDGYNVVQPAEIFEFMHRVLQAAGFSIHTAGSINGGAKIWALAQVGPGATIIGHDVVRPYLLAATSYDGSLSSTFKLTAIEVVCDNTLTASAGSAYKLDNGGQTESDRTKGPVVHSVRVPHSKKPNFEAITQQLGIVVSAWDRFIIEARLLAGQKVDEKFNREFLKSLLPAPKKDGIVGKVEDTVAFKELMAVITGEIPSRRDPEATGTAWGTLAAVTWYIDHIRGRDRTRLNNAWFGEGDAMKTKAKDALVSIMAY